MKKNDDGKNKGANVDKCVVAIVSMYHCQMRIANVCNILFLQVSQCLFRSKMLNCFYR